jgi:hypothetical protein
MTINDLITEADYAAQRGVSVRTIQRERALRTGPAFIKVGKKVFYRPEAISDWLLSKEQAQPRAMGRAF